MNIDSIRHCGHGCHQPRAKSEGRPEKILNAAKQFESLLVAQMMKSMQDCRRRMAGHRRGPVRFRRHGIRPGGFAQAMSASGGLGLAKMVADGRSSAPKMMPLRVPALPRVFRVRLRGESAKSAAARREPVRASTACAPGRIAFHASPSVRSSDSTSASGASSCRMLAVNRRSAHVLVERPPDSARVEPPA